MTGRSLRLLALACSSVLADACGGGSSPAGATSAAGGPSSFQGSVVLGSPTGTTIRASVYSADQGGSFSFQIGTSPGVYDRETAAVTIAAGQPQAVSVVGLQPDTRYYYRLAWRTTGGGSATTEERSFHTARPSGSTFAFTVQADSHLDENSDLELYRRTLSNVRADAGDFHVDLGDTFMCEKHTAPLTATQQTAGDQATVDARYAYERANFGLVGVPLFLVNGNHEGEAGWFANGTSENLAVWATKARQRFYLNPPPDVFYDGDATSEPFVGQRASCYAWHWGDALLVVLDPYWASRTKDNQDPWGLTLGEAQYRWLERTLASSGAAFKLVFVHSLVGGLDGQMRGGVEAAPYFEWGGRGADGRDSFAARRPGWGRPIHALLVRYGVTAVFHGHDHLYARQELDGVVYQEVPQPSARNTSSGSSLAAQYHYTSGTILSSSGHLRVTVSPERLTCEYVRAWLAANETTVRRNGQVDDSWSVGRR